LQALQVRSGAVRPTGTPGGPKNRRKRLSRVHIRGEEQSEIDWDRFAWALLQYARVLADSKAKQKDAA